MPVGPRTCPLISTPNERVICIGEECDFWELSYQDCTMFLQFEHFSKEICSTAANLRYIVGFIKKRKSGAMTPFEKSTLYCIGIVDSLSCMFAVGFEHAGPLLLAASYTLCGVTLLLSKRLIKLLRRR